MFCFLIAVYEEVYYRDNNKNQRSLLLTKNNGNIILLYRSSINKQEILFKKTFKIDFEKPVTFYTTNKEYLITIESTLLKEHKRKHKEHK